MELLLTEEAKEKLQNQINEGEQVLFDIEDGDGPFADSRVTCQLDTSFRLIIVKKNTTKDLSLYTEKVKTPIGVIWIKKSALIYMDNPTTIAVEPTYKSLQLKGASGLLKGNLQIMHAE
ncbi:iron-sulfur cluster biosynthesis family protein [Enterococcus villorum]|uniref:Core domain-containing protein n=2 Tax=Enterococcus villorum TaxID=112904 RepID=A0A511J2B6_9ENTE|nr:iron-sulfur cluster biosynthesis family protein [Enterococcus villorum]EOH91417.1 hypothetical protein UAO_00750 [Enterococcus villorum ATCC 700913]EOW76795.1 hypothetical protein I591_02103 [Enterococcus villorum ATCC 700913]GEL91833.1 hypothetical protein EVI01_11700 [Enterococcus villorum]